MLFSHALTEEQVQKIEEVRHLIQKHDVNSKRTARKERGGNELIQVTRQQFRKFARDHHAEKLAKSQNLWMFITDKKNGLPSRGRPIALWCDFLILRFSPEVLDVLNLPREARRELQTAIDSLKEAVRDQIARHGNPFNLLAADVDTTEVENQIPSVFLNTFIGYRRSSVDGQVVRFYFKTDLDPGRRSFVRYSNRYRSRETRWIVRGGGIYTENKTLYLFGHARDQRGVSRGYRVQALRQLGTTDMLCGPVLSQDRDGPIAARIVLVPYENHRWTKKQLALGTKPRIEDLLRIPERDSLEEHLDEIKHNVGKNFSDETKYGLLYYLSNLTPTVLKGSPDIDDQIIRSEVQLREICQTNADFDWKYKDQLLLGLKRRINDISTRY